MSRILVATRTLAAGALIAAAQASAPAQADEARSSLETALGAPDWLDLSGSVRARYETLSDSFFTGEAGPSDALASIQTSFRAEADLGQVVLVGELLDARLLWADEAGAGPAQANALEPVQAFVSWRPSRDLAISAGRFTQDVGSRRIVSRTNFGNVLTTFNGGRIDWTTPGVFAEGRTRITALYVLPSAREPSDSASAHDNEISLDQTLNHTRFWGAHVATPLPQEFEAELYAFRIDEKDAGDLPTRDRRFWTTGARLHRDPAHGKLDLDIEAVSQTGRSRASLASTADLDHDAHFFHVEAGYMFDAPWRPRVVVFYDLASGDKSPTDGRNQRFDTLFGDRAFEFGPTSIYGAVARANLDSFALRLEAQPNKRWDGYITLRNLRLDSATDSFASSGVVDRTGASGKSAGQQIDGRVRYWITPKILRLETGAAYFIRGDFLDGAPNATPGDDMAYGYAALTFNY